MTKSDYKQLEYTSIQEKDLRMMRCGCTKNNAILDNDMPLAQIHSLIYMYNIIVIDESTKSTEYIAFSMTPKGTDRIFNARSSHFEKSFHRSMYQVYHIFQKME